MVHTFIIEPIAYNAFENEGEQIEKCKEWGLLSDKAVKTKLFFYKGHGLNLACNIVGYVDKLTAVVSFENDQKHCIHPSYLKEMQAASYSQKTSIAADESTEPPVATVDVEPATIEEIQLPPASEVVNEEAAKPVTASKAKTKKEKAPKLELPEEKVKMSATVKEFTTVPNNFSDTDDEVVIYEVVEIQDPPLVIGDAWSSHSATLKKLELEIGDVLQFEGKIVAKKLTKHPIPYKINNPAKIQKIVE